MFKTSRLFEENYNTDAKVVVNQGGTSSGKTYAILQVLFCLAMQTERQIITVVGQDIPNLKAGALRDALNIVESSDILMSAIQSYNKTDRIFTMLNGSKIEFKSYENSIQKAKSGKRQYLFVNEANGIDFLVYTELAVRTTKRVFIDYNPNAEFWVHEWIIGKEGVKTIISDHRHNPFLDQDMRDKIEALKLIDKELWRVYARGATGKIRGLVLNNWYICEKIPDDAKHIALGLDFGFTNDETGCVDVFMQNGELWVEELFYKTGMTNPDISDKLKQNRVNRNSLIVADSAEPKSIEELRRLGWNIKGAPKGPDSVKASLDILKRYRINITRGSVNLRKELGRYVYKTDRTGRATNEPVDRFNHLIDPLRYIALNCLKISNLDKATSRLPHQAKTIYNDQLKGFL
jgi:phage terminase large subunit